LFLYTGNYFTINLYKFCTCSKFEQNDRQYAFKAVIVASRDHLIVHVQ
jgi:hypothetical protein